MNTIYNDSGTITLPHTYYMVTADGNSTGAPVPANGLPTNALTYTPVTTVDLGGCNDGNGPTGSSHSTGVPCVAILLDHLQPQ